MIDDQIIPPHMWHLERFFFWFNLNHFAFDPIKTGGVAIFATHGGHQLHANANS